MIGKTINHYKILEKLGEGGMGVVYKAEDTKLQRLVALKFLPQSSSQDEEAKKRFINEARAASALDHPNICTLHEIGDAKGGQMYMAMAYYGGQSLKDKIAQGPLPVAEALDIAIQTARGLARAHEEDITHRDIKPANLMVTERHEVKIVDFGLAKLAAVTKFTKSGLTLGTVSYMSPEQAQGIAADHRTDIWSLGVVLYEMLTGKQPYTGDYDQAVVYSLINEKHEPLTQVNKDVPSELEVILDHALAKKAADRYQATEEMLADLQVVSKNLQAVRSGAKPARLKMRRRSPVKGNSLATLIAAFLVIAVGLWFFFVREKQSDVGHSVSLAVLPLKGFGEEVSEDWFRDSMTDALITDLTKIGGLRVISQNSTMQYKDSDKSIPTIGKELQVEYVIDASIVKVGEQIRISAKLVNAPTNENIWAENFQRNLSGVFQLQAELAQMIARQVRVELTPSEQIRLATRPEVNPEAYEAYLRGRYLSEMRLFRSEETLTNATNYYYRALSFDSTFALAYAGLAQLHLAAARGSLITPSQAYLKANAAIQRALQLDPDLAEAYTASAQLRWEADWDWAGAKRDFMRALELNPGSSFVHYFYSAYLQLTGDFGAGIEAAKRGLQLDPLNNDMNLMLAFAHFNMNQYGEAIEQLQNMLALGQLPGVVHMELAWNYAMQDNYSQALAEIRLVEETYPSVSEKFADSRGFIYGIAGERKRALEILQDLQMKAADGYIDKNAFALVHAGLDNTDEVFRWLNKAIDERSPNVIWPWPFLQRIYKDPRYKQFLKRLNFAEGDKRFEIANAKF